MKKKKIKKITEKKLQSMMDKINKFMYPNGRAAYWNRITELAGRSDFIIDKPKEEK